MRYQRGKNARKKSGTLFVFGIVIGLCLAVSLMQSKRRNRPTLEALPIVRLHEETSGRRGRGKVDRDFVQTALVTGEIGQASGNGPAIDDSQGIVKLVVVRSDDRDADDSVMARVEPPEPDRPVLVVTGPAPDLASVVSGVGEKIREFERRMAVAGEKIHNAADHLGSKLKQKSGRRLEAGEASEKMLARSPKAPGQSIDSADVRAHEKYQIRSRPCATREKAIDETRTGLESFVASRLKEHGLNDSRFVRKAIEQLHPKYEVEESFREVAGDRYSLYTASVSVDLGPNFEKQSLRLVNQQTARQRFAGLMGLSCGILALLIGIDQLLPGRPRELASAASNIA